MRVKVDYANKAVIAEIIRKGNYFKGVSVCSKEDTFDEDFGIKLAKAKCFLKKNIAQKKMHEKAVKIMEKEVKRLTSAIKSESEVILEIAEKIETNNKDIRKIISDKY